jgi:HD-GYP domain-containing protein (c-di-GMP phosphodiesterase class II)
VSRVEILAVLSLVSDLGMGQPMEHALRQTLLAHGLAQRIGLDADQQEATFYAGLLAWVGCHIDAYEQAKWFGDDLAIKADIRHVDLSSSAADLAFVLRRIGAGRSLAERLKTQAAFVRQGFDDLDVMMDNHCVAATDLATGLGLGGDVCTSIRQSFERWDGRGDPDGAKGEAIVTSSRLICLADVAVVFHRIGGVDAAVEVARERRGTQFDPALVDVFVDLASELFGDLEQVEPWDAVLTAEPDHGRLLSDDELDAALEAVADFVDVKSPFTIGHSRGVADLGREAARGLGLPARDVTDIGRAGLLHDLGRVGVPNSVWDKRGELTVSETERMRLHPYLTERTLASSPGLSELGLVASQHHERLDGSGYPRGLRHDALGPGSRLLAVADAYRGKLEPRPHREVMDPPAAAAFVREEVQAGRLDGDAADAVLRAAGHRSRRRREAVAGLTPREVEVLRLLALGHSTKAIATELGITRKTASNHLEHIYTKLGVTNRARASLLAAKHGLIEPADLEDQGLA